MPPRKQPNLSELLAAALLRIKQGDEWLIDDEYLREKGTAQEIRSYVEFDHARRHAENGGNNPQNLYPMRKPDHREKSRADTTEIAKGKRIGRKQQEFLRKILAKGGQDVPSFDTEKNRETSCSPKTKIPTRPWPKTSRPLCAGRKIPARPLPKRLRPNPKTE